MYGSRRGATEIINLIADPVEAVSTRPMRFPHKEREWRGTWLGRIVFTLRLFPRNGIGVRSGLFSSVPITSHV